METFLDRTFPLLEDEGVAALSTPLIDFAGLGIGYLAGSQRVEDVIRRTCVVYSVNTIAQDAAIKAIEDENHILRTRRCMALARTYLKTELTRP